MTTATETQPAITDTQDAYKVEFIRRRKNIFGLSLVRVSDNLPVLDFYGEYKAHRTRADVSPETEAWAATVCSAMNATAREVTQ